MSHNYFKSVVFHHFSKRLSEAFISLINGTCSLLSVGYLSVKNCFARFVLIYLSCAIYRFVKWFPDLQNLQSGQCLSQRVLVYPSTQLVVWLS